MTQLKIRTNLCAGITGFVIAVVFFILTKLTIKIPSSESGMLNAQTVPILLCACIAGCSIYLIVKALFFKQNDESEKQIATELRNVIYIFMLLTYMVAIRIFGFLIASEMIGIGSLLFLRERKVLRYVIVAAFILGIWATFTFGLRIELPGFLGG